MLCRANKTQARNATNSRTTRSTGKDRTTTVTCRFLASIRMQHYHGTTITVATFRAFFRAEIFYEIFF